MKKALEERWEKIDGFPNYLVSNYGEVVNQTTGWEIKATSVQSGHLKVGLSNKGNTKTCYVHRLVAKAFLVDYEEEFEIKHKDNNLLDNSVLNLRVGAKRKGY